MTKYIVAGVVALVLIVGGTYYATHMNSSGSAQNQGTDQNAQTSTTTPEANEQSVIGKSVEGRDITAYHFGSGEKEILFVGGIHGGYEWNTALVALQLIDYLRANPSAIPASVRVTVIPAVNPDGLAKVVATTTAFTAADVNSSQALQVAGRFNAHTVDLNRNFDCDWKASGTWQTKKVSGGSAAFSEPESFALKTYVETAKPMAVVVWYSSAGGVFSSNCRGGVLAETKTLTDVFAKASGYPAYAVFNYYEVTGDMANWLARIQIPTISVLLTNHTDTEWDKNQKGIDALLQHYAP